LSAGNSLLCDRSRRRHLRSWVAIARLYFRLCWQGVPLPAGGVAHGI